VLSPLGRKADQNYQALVGTGQEGHPAHENKQHCHITRCHFDHWEP